MLAGCQPTMKFSQPNQKRLSQTKLMVATLNVGAFSGKAREIADALERRKFDKACMQKTRWKSDKARDMNAEYRLDYASADKNSRGGVGIILGSSFREKVIKGR